jgi:D-alanyl-D-alanine carboxypeptidase/D-alanyl-D-alanine-endopeptidase (penicillin-binding protein 4)
MRRIDSTIRAAVCVSALAAACVLAMGQSAPPGAGNQTAQGNAGGQAGAATGQTAAYAAKPLPLDQKPLALAQQIAALMAQPAVARAHWGIVVTTLDGKPIYALNEAQLFQPASNAKLFTTAAAMALLGADHTFQTVVAITTTIKRGVLRGNLFLVGGGDANFGAQDVPYVRPADRPKTPPQPQTGIPDIDNLADQIVAKGIRRIEGNILGDDSVYEWHPYPQGWSWDDLVWGYGAPVSALTIHDNAMHIDVAPGSSAVIPDFPYYTISNHVGITSAPTRDCDAIRFSRSPGSKELTLEGTLPDKAQPCPETIAIDDPAEYAAISLKAALEKRGVKIEGSAKAWHNDPESGGRSPVSIDALPATHAAPKSGIEGCLEVVNDGPNVNVIVQHNSPPLMADVTFTNKVSQNLHAEVLLRNIAQLDCDHSGAYPKAVSQFLINEGIDKDDFVFYDGSGLSGYDLVTPRAVAKLLSFAAHDPKSGAPQPWFAEWKASLPVGGVDGTLADRFTTAPLKGHVFAKTGTHSEGRALSGYLECASGQTVIFSILVDHQLPGDDADRDAMDKIVAAIAAAE